jgi:D-alanyl-D-alanine carboxypeptidase/D-alanyl-D-alanine-endopeptidase (penicillin-binding protein 4)
LASVLQRWACAGLLAAVVGLSSCAATVSEASPTSLGRPSSTTSSSTSSTTPTLALPFAGRPAATTSTAAPGLPSALDTVWAATPKDSCLMVMDGKTVLYERNPDLPVVPASTQKLLTVTAVLTRLDPASRLRTTLVASAPPDLTGTVHGDVFLVGGGDPLLSTGDWAGHFTRSRLHTRIEPLADRLRAAGVSRITGKLLGDDGRYDRQRYVPSWPASYRTDHEAGPLSALLVNDGAASWTSYREIPVGDPTVAATDTVAHLLRERGISVDGGTGAGTAPVGQVELAGIDSPTIAEIAGTVLLDSHNNAAELLLRELGLRVLGEGSTDAGRRVVLDTLTKMGMPMAGVQYVDASGLDRGNRVTCRLLTSLLTSSPVRDLVTPALPVAARTGTLWRRFGNTPAAGRLRAKTGSLRGITALAGYADGPVGALTFAFEQVNVGGLQGDHLQDQLGSALVNGR